MKIMIMNINALVIDLSHKADSHVFGVSNKGHFMCTAVSVGMKFCYWKHMVLFSKTKNSLSESFPESLF